MEQDAHYTPNGLKSRALPSTVSSSNATESGCYNWDNKFSSDDNIDLDITDESRVAFIDNNSKETNFQTEHLRKKTSENGVVMSIKGEVTSPRRNDLKNVDSRWSIAVAVVSLLAQALMGGYVYTGGIYYTILSKEFPDSSPVFVSWLCSLPLTLWFLGSPVGSIITNRYGCRACSLVGGALGGLGLTLCYLATNIYMVFFFYGIISGMGFGIQYVGFVTSVSRYFNKYRNVVTILAGIGPTCGMAVYSFFVPYLTSIYQWRGSLFILGAISFNICACACALYPINIGKPSRRFFHFQLFKNMHFLLFCLHCILCNLSNAMVVLHMPSLLLSYGFSSAIASLSLTIFASSNSLAKLILSIVGHVLTLDVVFVYVAFLVSDGTAAILTPLVNSSAWILTFIAVVGFLLCNWWTYPSRHPRTRWPR